jgi:1-phosphofructokinase
VIITVTLNPSLDRTIDIPHLARGEVVRATATSVEAGGKGVNVSRALLANGVTSIAVLPLGGAVGEEMEALLKQSGVDMSVVPVNGATRSNITLCEVDGTTTKVNEAGAPLTADELARLEEVVLQLASEDDWVVFSGSLPAGAPSSTYASWVRRLIPMGVRVALDTSGSALTEALSSRPTLIKPNRNELAEAVNAPIGSFSDAVNAARSLQNSGAQTVLVSLDADGALLVERGVVAALCSASARRSTVGTGDCLLAGFLAAGASGEKALLTAVKWAAASVALPGSGVPSQAQIAELHPDLITDIESRELSRSS